MTTGQLEGGSKWPKSLGTGFKCSPRVSYWAPRSWNIHSTAPQSRQPAQVTTPLSRDQGLHPSNRQAKQPFCSVRKPTTQHTSGTRPGTSLDRIFFLGGG